VNVSLNIEKRQSSSPTAQYDAVIMGAGPYGLSAAAHLRERGLKVATFGKPIYFWQKHMPKGMLLRSFWWATNLSDPRGKYGFEQFFQAKGLQATDPLAIQTFIDYGLWFQKNAVPDLDETYIANIQRRDEKFVVTLEDGRIIESKTVVMAPGLQYYIYRPAEYAHMPSSLVSHSADHSAFDQFVGKEVVVIGRGQGSLETAALLNEQGTKVQVISRQSLRWVPVANMEIPALIRQVRSPKAGMGSGWLNLLLEKYPYVYQRLPRNTRDELLSSRHGPAGSHWLKPRILDKISIHEGKRIEKVEEVNDRVKLTLSDGETIEADHVILGTGYRAELKNLPMLDSSLLDSIQTYLGSPELNPWFESSVPGLYFIGFSAARCFGPLYRFVVGTDAASHRVASAVSRQVTRV
jgi:FAD-dependent urate hydroxylase